MKTFDVGFGSGAAGKPHADISLAKIIVYLHGEAQLMPWNSSKSDVNSSHEVFLALQAWLQSVVKYSTSLSRRLSRAPGGWPEQVFRYASGEPVEVVLDSLPTAVTSYLPPLPVAVQRYDEIVQRENKDVSVKQPWTTGLYESMIAVDSILKKTYQQKNRFALILLDSTLEIAFKEYLGNDSGKAYNDAKLLAIFERIDSSHGRAHASPKRRRVWQR